MSLTALHISVVISGNHSLCVQCAVCMAQLQILRRQLTTFVMAHHDSYSRHNDTQCVFSVCVVPIFHKQIVPDQTLSELCGFTFPHCYDWWAHI